MAKPLLHIVWDLLGGRVAVVHRDLHGARMEQLHLMLHLSLLCVHPGWETQGFPMGKPCGSLCGEKKNGLLLDDGS